MKKILKDILLQMIPVMIGVYLGFLVSDWSESNRKQERYEQLKATLLAEIQLNKQHLEGVIDYHRIVKDSSRYFANPQNPVRKPNFFQGTRMTKLSNSAYMTGIQTGTINEFTIAEIQYLNQVYTLQNVYNDYGNLILSNLISLDFSEKEEDIRRIARFLETTMVDVVVMEEALIKQYDKLQGKLSK